MNADVWFWKLGRGMVCHSHSISGYFIINKSFVNEFSSMICCTM